MILILIVAGWIVGAFVNYIVDILPLTRKLTAPMCVKCQQPTTWQGYLLLGKHPCGHNRKFRDYSVQIIGMLVSLLLWHYPSKDITVQLWPPALNYLLGLVVAAYFAVVLIMDVEYRVVMHPISIAGAIFGFVFGIFLHGIIPTLLGGAVGFGIMYIFYFAGILFIRFMAKRRGNPVDEVALGYGDVNLAGVLGLLLGWPAIGVCLLFAVLLAGAVSLLLIIGMLALRKYDELTAIPYAPFLVLAAAWILFR